MKIYTKTGDDGTTAIFQGKRVGKSDPEIELEGTLDEANAYLGLVACLVTDPHEASFIIRLQSDLFSIGSTISGVKNDLSLLATDTQLLEDAMDRMANLLPDLSNFILPGPTKETSCIHIARTVVRRTERRMVKYLTVNKSGNIHLKKSSLEILAFLNRLSDYLFMLARLECAHQGKTDVIWKGLLHKKA